MGRRQRCFKDSLDKYGQKPSFHYDFDSLILLFRLISKKLQNRCYCTENLRMIYA